MKPLAAALLLLPLAGCLETELAPGASGAGSDGLYYKYGEAPSAPDAQVDPGRALNAYRTERGLPRLRVSPQLAAAAQAHARDMARMGKVGHVGSDGSSVMQRVRAQGYDAAEVAENAAWTARGFPTVLEGWDESPSHRKTLRRRDVADYGIGRAGDYWVLLVGLRK
ncbi:CAP domain-containing protein [Salipiger sp. P9]|uniref:CAP domain-containing protein n=1 Tax=Salipiger pentaromativorans TaxID=2943193 RepID=UPI002157B06A|nr:CAP domain-containing protein [Salipiger pentaromativorans]MCR8546532.1 CAP domain-containing protein [Salipiger pentaromativorans]